MACEGFSDDDQAAKRERGWLTLTGEGSRVYWAGFFPVDVGGLIRVSLVDDVERPTGIEGVRQTSRWWRLLRVDPQTSLIEDHREGELKLPW